MTEQETVSVSHDPSENKRKLDDLVESRRPLPEDVNFNANVESVDGVNGGGVVDSDLKDAKRIRLDEEAVVKGDANGHEVENVSGSVEDKDVENMLEKAEQADSEIKIAEGLVGTEERAADKVDVVEEAIPEEGAKESIDAENIQSKENFEADGTSGNVEDQVKLAENVQEDGSAVKEKADADANTTSRTMEIPNNKVGVLIGKAGDTIRYLQINSGAKIQITRDAEADPHAPTRPVELIGSVESIEKAEKLIKDVISEADAGGVPSLVARGIATAQTVAAAEQVQMQVPNDKVGMIIGKGGETIKYLQATSGARIQLIPQHLPEGDQSTERIVRITGDKKKIEIAREMIMEVMTKPMRHSPRFGGYNQQSERYFGPSGPWGPRDGPYGQHSRYDYHHQGPNYRPPGYDHFPGPNYGPRGGYGTGWQQQPPMHRPPYDNYGRSGHFMEGPAGIRGNSAAPNMGPMPNHNYGYPPQHPHAGPPPSSYGHGYDEMKYGTQAPVEHPYGVQGNTQQAYAQNYPSYPGYASNQQYGKPSSYPTPNAVQSAAPQSYGAPRPEATYQAGNPATVQPYGVPPQQTAPYPTGAPTQSSYPTYPAAEGYAQPQQAAAPAYVQQAASGYAQPVAQQVPGSYVQQPANYAQPQHAPVAYAQQNATVYPQPVAQQTPGAYPQQVASGYSQPTAQQATSVYGSQGLQPGTYSSYPTSQPVYTDQSSASTTVYTYQAATTVPDPNASYSGPQQQGYAQSQSQPGQATTYDQSATK